MSNWSIEKLFELAQDDVREITPIRRSNGLTVFVASSLESSRHLEDAMNDYQQKKEWEKRNKL